jgi:phosphoserine phosphatase
MRLVGVLITYVLLSACVDGKPQVLSSWVEGATRSAIIDFVAEVTTEGSPHFVPVVDRIAVFDHDGTLWAERPEYFQFLMIYEQVRAQAADHPEWREEQPFKAVLGNDTAYLDGLDYAAARQLSAAVSGGMTTTDYMALSHDFATRSLHPEFNARYADLRYQPMLELLEYLEGHGFRVFIVSGGDMGFIRGFSEPLYGIPRDRVIGSSRSNMFADDSSSILRGKKYASMNVGANKALNIDLHIGRPPVFAVGNSDGDLAMLAYTASHDGFVLLLSHDDDEREYGYTDGAEVALQAAHEEGWTVASMHDDFERIFVQTN